MKSDMIVKKGDVFLLTAGEYSDFRIIGFFQALRKLNLEVLRTTFADTLLKKGRKLFPEQPNLIFDSIRKLPEYADLWSTNDAFAHWLNDKKFATLLTYTEIDLRTSFNNEWNEYTTRD